MENPKQDETGSAVVPVLACVLKQLCTRNDRLPVSSRGVSKFHALHPPGISIKDYLARIANYAACSGECFVLALVYIDRIIQSNPSFVVNSLNIHRLLITSVMLAAKFFDDQYFNNAYFAKVGGVPCSEINLLEVEFLFMTNFTLFVTTETYRQYYNELCNHAQNPVCGCSDRKVPDLVVPSLPTGPSINFDELFPEEDKSEVHGNTPVPMNESPYTSKPRRLAGHSSSASGMATSPDRKPSSSSSAGYPRGWATSREPNYSQSQQPHPQPQQQAHQQPFAQPQPVHHHHSQSQSSGPHPVSNLSNQLHARSHSQSQAPVPVPAQPHQSHSRAARPGSASSSSSSSAESPPVSV